MDIRENIIFTIARMNPPTPGHLSLVRRLIHEALTRDTRKVYILLSKTYNDIENPLDCRFKQSILGNEEDRELTDTMIENEKRIMMEETNNDELRRSISNIQVVTKCALQGSPVYLITPLINSPEYNGKILSLFLIIGIDRKDLLDSIIKSYSKNERLESVGGIALTRENMEEYKSLTPRRLNALNISTMPTEAMSASFIRKIVLNGLKDKFDKIYSRHLPQPKIDILYTSILEGMTKKNSQNKKTEKRKKPNNSEPKTKTKKNRK